MILPASSAMLKEICPAGGGHFGRKTAGDSRLHGFSMQRDKIMNVPMSILITNLLGLFLLMAVGVLVVRFNILPVTATTYLSRLLMSVMAPALIFQSLIRPFSMDFLVDSAVIFAVGMAAYLLFIGLSSLLARLFHVPKDRRGIWAICTTFPNNGFMGFPVIQAVLGDEALALAAIMGIPFNMLLYTVGVRVLWADRSAGEGAPKISLKKILLTPVNAATALGLVVFLFQIPVPEVLSTPIGHLANVATPLSMLIIGMELTKSSVSKVIQDRAVLAGTFTKLVAVPLVSLLLLRIIPLTNPLIAPVVLITMAMPTAAIASALAKQYEVNVDLPVGITFMTNLLCMITMPLISLLM